MTDLNRPLPKLTSDESNAVAVNYLASLEHGVLPEELFTQMGRLIVLSTVELGMVRPLDESGRTKILLTQRPSNDRFWPNQWHVPGSVVRADDPVKHDHDYDAAISRIRDEVGGTLAIIGKPHEFETIRRTGPRGSETTTRVVAETSGDPLNGEFFDVVDVLDNPPKGGLIENHDVAIARIAAAQKKLSEHK